MAADIYLTLALFLGVFAGPLALGTLLNERRFPLVTGVAVLVAVVCLVRAVQLSEAPLTWASLPDAVIRVVGLILGPG